MKYFDKVKSSFKMTKKKRIVILSVTLVATILGITLGTVFYVSKSIRKSIEYGGGHEWVMKVNPLGNEFGDEIATDVAENIYGRLDPLGVEGASVTAETDPESHEGFVRVKFPATSDDEVARTEDIISHKPVLTMTDFYGNPLFNSRGGFTGLQGDPAGFVMGGDASDYDYEANSRVPLVENGAESQLNQNGRYEVALELDGTSGANAWAQATDYVSQLPQGKNVIVTWIDISRFLDGVETFYTQMNPSWDQVWSQAGHNPLLLTHIDGDINKPWRTATDADPLDHMLSSATVASRMQTNHVVISGNFSSDEAKTLADQINYGVSNYELEILYDRPIGGDQ